MKKIVLAIFLLTSIVSCKNEKKETEKLIEKETPEVEKEVVTEEFVKVTFNAVVPKDDMFSLQYKKTDEKWYPKKGIEVKVNGSEYPQDIVFSLPSNTFPIGFIFIVGENNTENVVINSATFDLEGRKYSISKENFHQFFNPNKYIEFNKSDNSYKINKKADNARPFFNSRRLLIKRLEEKFY
ncbi:hypothetical protein [Idiomarina abyssalis]|uniref:hypothetical protein n=1 Tax=Idiomarina abyssalis TaxID=86102 RepID=UPI003A935500